MLARTLAKRSLMRKLCLICAFLLLLIVGFLHSAGQCVIVCKIAPTMQSEYPPVARIVYAANDGIHLMELARGHMNWYYTYTTGEMIGSIGCGPRPANREIFLPEHRLLKRDCQEQLELSFEMKPLSCTVSYWSEFEQDENYSLPYHEQQADFDGRFLTLTTEPGSFIYQFEGVWEQGTASYYLFIEDDGT